MGRSGADRDPTLAVFRLDRPEPSWQDPGLFSMTGIGVDHRSGKGTLPLMWADSRKAPTAMLAFLGAQASCPHPRRNEGETPALPGRKNRVGRQQR